MNAASRTVLGCFGLGLLVACGGGGGGGGFEFTEGSVDFGVDRGAIVRSLALSDEFFPAQHCAVIEGATQVGTRRLLRFDTILVNYGDQDFVLGDPSDPESPYTTANFEFSPCHGHYHFDGWTDYHLEDGLGAPVAFGHKEAFCLLDSINVAGGFSHGYTCSFQGLTAGWGDSYPGQLDGQWVDVTDVPAGTYTLVVTVNAQGIVDEGANLRPNTVTVEVVLPDPNLPLP